MTDTPLDTAAIRARCDAASPGPWTVDMDGCIIAPINLANYKYITEGFAYEVPDRAFIAHARTDIPALLDALAATEATMAGMLIASKQIEARLAMTEGFLAARDAEIAELKKPWKAVIPESALTNVRLGDLMIAHGCITCPKCHQGCSICRTCACYVHSIAPR